MQTTRRQFIAATALAAAAGVAAADPRRVAMANETPESPLNRPIIDTHQHLWDLKRLRLPWLAGAPEKLQRSFGTADYLVATAGLDVRAVYMEVDVAEADHVAEAEHVIALATDPAQPTVAAVIGGRPGEDGFEAYIRRFAGEPAVKGVRRVLHG
ncbi:MAG: twin-arginine translocation signal domain-containing protein, partial [Planctomycetales bacterium]|nr:twin-arginine translocation signal domain-containing protein [Planctomycetales bacterium]